MRGKVDRLLALYDTRFWPAQSRMQLCIAQFLIQADGSPGLHSQEEKISSMAESLNVGFFPEDQLPKLHIGHSQRVPMAFRLFRGEISAPFFDRG
jgi:hypothetical protein